MSNAALIVAAGRGLRAKSDDCDLPKQYRDLCGKSVLSRTLSVFCAHPLIQRVAVVIHENDLQLYETSLLSIHHDLAQKLDWPIFGGGTRQESVLNGLERLLEDPPDNVLIHDGVRPFVSLELIETVLAGLETDQAVVPALPVVDSLKSADEGYLNRNVNRDGLWRVQTPQGFRFREIYEAHKAAIKQGQNSFTDDTALLQWHGGRVRIVAGSEKNIKLTSAEDFHLAQAYLTIDGEEPDKQEGQKKSMGSIRVGNGFDVHAFEPGDEVILCGVKIPHSAKLKGHSDADVGLHALTDALLGALGDGDIGSHFPPSDPKWQGADSTLFLAYARQMVLDRGGSIDHVDVTLICQAPKVGPHRQAMRERLAHLLAINIERVSVKATTTERLGFTGREEGIAAMATATVSLP